MISAKRLEEIKQRQTGCSDGGCVFGHRGGMQTNGGCHCIPRFSKPLPSERIELRKKIEAMAKERKELIEALELYNCQCPAPDLNTKKDYCFGCSKFVRR